ncbi:MAG: ATP-binding protein [Candidatus Zixiibacteriota bacterium]
MDLRQPWTFEGSNLLETDASNARNWIILGVILAVLSAAHFLSPTHHSWIHDFLFKVTYVPIVLAGLWLGWRGGLIMAALTGAVYIFHIRMQLAGHHEYSQVSLILELVLYVFIGVMVGWLSDRQRLAQARIAAANTELQESLASLREKTEALLAAEESLRRADRLRAAGEIATGLAHEVRNPLGGIVGAAEIITNPKTPPKDREEFTEVLSHEVKRLDRVIGDFLDFARPGKTSGGACNLREQLDFVASLTAGPRGKKNAAFRCDDVADNIRIGMSADAFRQVALNLTLNALTALPDGNGQITWSATQSERTVRITVRDNGRGIDPSVRERLFEPFVTTTRGTGLGLAIVARLVNDVGGSISLVDSDQDGTVFELTVPLS